MSNQQTSRYRKQRFPRSDRRKPNTSYVHSTFSDEESVSDDESFFCAKRIRPSAPTVSRSFRPTKSVESNTSTCRLDKRARDEHNEQERSRRRELAVIYELIRCSFSEEDLRYLGSCNGPKSIDKLSYPQVLHIAHQLICEEQHNLILFEKTMSELKRVEKELLRVGLPIPERPAHPSIPDAYRKIVQLVDGLLKHDKSARTMDGVYEMTPAERAAIGDQQLSMLGMQLQGSPNSIASYSQLDSYQKRIREQKRNCSMRVNKYRVDDFSMFPEHARSGRVPANDSGTWPRIRQFRRFNYADEDEDEDAAHSTSQSPSPVDMPHSLKRPRTGYASTDDMPYFSDSLKFEDDEDDDITINFLPQRY